MNTPDGYICSLNIRDGIVQFSRVIEHSNDAYNTPILFMGFPIEKYARLAVLFREMHRLKITPQLYLWENDDNAINLTVFLYTDTPSRKTIDAALHGTGDAQTDAIEKWSALATNVTTTMERKFSLEFLQRFLNAQSALIVFLESIDGVMPDNTTLEGKNPVSVFTITPNDLLLKPFMT